MKSCPKIIVYRLSRVAEVAQEHGWHPPKSLDSDENFKPEHTLFCCELRFVAIYMLYKASFLNPNIRYIVAILRFVAIYALYKASFLNPNIRYFVAMLRFVAIFAL